MIKYECPVQLNTLYFFLFHKKALNILTTVLYSSSFVLCFRTVCFTGQCRVNICHLVSFSTPKNISEVEQTFRCRPCLLFKLLYTLPGAGERGPFPLREFLFPYKSEQNRWQYLNKIFFRSNLSNIYYDSFLDIFVFF
jgi:hypothetical protein